MYYRERGFQAQGVYPTQYTSSMGTSRVKQEEETDKNDVRVARNLEERNVGRKGKSLKQGLISAKDLTIELPEGRDCSAMLVIYGSLEHSINITSTLSQRNNHLYMNDGVPNMQEYTQFQSD